MLKRYNLSRWILATTLCAGMAIPQTAQAASHKEMLDLIPDDAWGFLMAGSLDGIDAKSKMLKSMLGLPIPDDVSNMALAQFNMVDIVDRKSPIFAVMMDAQKFAGSDRAAVLLVAVTDSKALLERIEAEDPIEGVSKCVVMGEPAYAVVRGKIVILGPDLDCVTKVAKSKKTLGESMAKPRLAVIEKSDVFLSISLASVVNAYKDMFLPMAQMMMAPTDPEGKGIKRFVKALSEVGSLDFALTMDDAGFALRMLIDPLKESDLQKLFADEKCTTDSLLAGLPSESFLFTMGSKAANSEHGASFQSQSPLSDMMKMTGMDGIDTSALEILDKEFISIQKSIKQYAMCLAALPEGADGIFGLTLVAETEDSKAFIESVRKAYETAWKVSDDEELAAIKGAVVHKADAETIDGHKVDTLSVDLKKLSEIDDTDDDTEIQHVQALFGKDMVLRFGATDGKRVVFTFGGGKSRFETASKAQQSSGAKLSADKGISAMSGQLPSPRSGEYFIAADTIIQTVKRALKAVGSDDDFPIDVPTLNSPIGGSTTVQDKVMRIDFMVPMKLIKAGKDAYDSYSASAADEDFDELDDEADDEAADDGDE